MPWTRFPIFDRWRDLTRFWIASEAALGAEHQRWSSLPINQPAQVAVVDPSGLTNFRCQLPDYVAALGDTHRLYSMLLASYVALVEEHGRNMIEYMIAQKGITRAAFPNIDLVLPPDAAAEKYVRVFKIETWGTTLLTAVGRSWADVHGGQSALVEVYVVRNIAMHGSLVFNQTAANRLADVGYINPPWAIGAAVTVDRNTFAEYLANLRSFVRAVAGGAAVAP